jgi:hypothetical protein
MTIIKLFIAAVVFLFCWLGSRLGMANGRFDLDSGIDRLFYYPGQGHLFGLPTRPGTSSAATTGVPTAGIHGFAPSALFFNFRGSAGSALYVNTGTFTSATWVNIA